MTPDQRIWRAAVNGGVVAFVLVELLRVWLPSLIPPAMGERFGASAAASGIAVILAALVAANAHRSVGRLWTGAATVIAVSRVGVLVLDGYWLLAASTIGVSACVVALIALAAASADAGRAARMGVLTGAALASAVHVATRTAGLIWPQSPATLLAAALIALAVLTSSVWASRSLTVPSSHDAVPADSPSDTAAAAPWLLIAPILLLAIAVTGAPGRLSLASGLGAAGVAAVVTGIQGLGVLAAVVAPSIGTARAALAGAMLVLIGTSSAYSASAISIAGATAAAIGLGLLVGAEPATHLGGPRLRSFAAAAGLSFFVVLVTAAAIAVNMSSAGGESIIALVAAVFAAGIGIVVCRPTRSAPQPSPAIGSAIAATSAAVAITSAFASIAASTPPTLLEGDPRTESGSWLLRALTLSDETSDSSEADELLAATGPRRADPLPLGPSAGGDTVTIATYGITSGFGMDRRFSPQRQARLLAETDPDIVSLTGVDRGSLLSGGHDSLRLFAGELGLPRQRFAPSSMSRGTALLTRHPVVEFTTRPLPKSPRARRRSQFTAVLRIHDRDLAVIGTQLASPSSDERLPQARAVAASVAQLRELDVPTVLAGELNAEPSDPVVTTLEALLDDLLAPSLATSPADMPTQRLHYVMLSEELRGGVVQRPRSGAAGHLPVALTVAFASSPA